MRLGIIASTLLLHCAFFGQTSLRAQQEIISLGPGYTDEVYYDMQEGITSRSPIASWEIGFQVTGFASSIITNGGTGVTLYVVPDKGIEGFGEAIDTAGMVESWKPWYNSTSTWDQGAFNLNSDYETGLFGWGEYNMVTHQVSGSTLYVIVLPDGTAKQIAIDGLMSGTYNFSYADIDGSNQVSAELKKSDYAGKNFGYYSLTEGKALDPEPQAEQWDLVFGKYIALVGPDADIPYGVTGVRSNPEVLTAEVESTTPETVETPSLDVFTTDITNIGHDWKEYAGSWTLRDVAYFVQDTDDNIFRIVFTDFGGSGTGEITLSKKQMGVSSVQNAERTIGRFGIYPNILSAGERATILLSLDQPVSTARILVTDAAGRTVATETPEAKTGLQQIPLGIDLPSGWYSVSVDLDGVRQNRAIIVQ